MEPHTQRLFGFMAKSTTLQENGSKQAGFSKLSKALSQEPYPSSDAYSAE